MVGIAFDRRNRAAELAVGCCIFHFSAQISPGRTPPETRSKLRSQNRAPKLYLEGEWVTLTAHRPPPTVRAR